MPYIHSLPTREYVNVYAFVCFSPKCHVLFAWSPGNCKSCQITNIQCMYIENHYMSDALFCLTIGWSWNICVNVYIWILKQFDTYTFVKKTNMVNQDRPGSLALKTNGFLSSYNIEILRLLSDFYPCNGEVRGVLFELTMIFVLSKPS